MEGKKEEEEEVWVWAGVSVGGVEVEVVVGDPGWSGNRNVGLLLECTGMFRAVGG